jgi:hypothetical protein
LLAVRLLIDSAFLYERPRQIPEGLERSPALALFVLSSVFKEHRPRERVAL